MTSWTEADFERLCWHDCHVHGFFLVERPYGCADIILDLDFISAWEESEDRSLHFRVAAATLVFHDVFGLVLSLDYRTPGAGMVPFSIEGIYRESIAADAQSPRFRYTMPINWPDGSITFEGYRFTQTLRAEPVTTSRRLLEPHQRPPLFG